MNKKRVLLLCGATVLTAALAAGAVFAWKNISHSHEMEKAGIWRQQNGSHWGERLARGGSAESAAKLAKKVIDIQERYLSPENKVFCAVIPDKGYYLQGQGAPAADYKAFFSTASNAFAGSNVQWIDLTGALSADQFYTTDSHWRQETLQPVLDALGNKMDFSVSLSDFTPHNAMMFAGAYGKYGAKPADELIYLTNQATDTAAADNFQHPEAASVYDLDKLSSDVPYDVFLSGATPLVTVTSPNSRSDRELILFRDSFSSSLAPLLLDYYRTVTLVDIRYMSSALLPQYLEFTDQDVLFLYSTLVADQPGLLK